MSYQFNKLSLKSAVICALALAACATPNATETVSVADTSVAPTSSVASVTVNVSGFNVEEGYVMAALVDAKGYKGGKPLQGRKVTVDSDTVLMTFSDLPSGEYAIRMYHDENGDGNMNTNAFGMPTEPFAFSNNAVGSMGPAPWSKAKFTVSGDTVQNISF